MTRIQRCLTEIRAVRNVAQGAEPPYVARSRLGRLTTSAAMLVADMLSNVEEPSRSVVIGGDRVTGGAVSTLSACCKRVEELSRHVRQPSEPLSERWKRAWAELLMELGILEQHLKDLEGASMSTRK